MEVFGADYRGEGAHGGWGIVNTLYLIGGPNAWSAGRFYNLENKTFWGCFFHWLY